MTRSPFLDVLSRRADAAAVTVPDLLAARLSTYFENLARWNQTINLSGFPLDRPEDRAVDRLIIEPLVVARALDRPFRATIDIGSGGGSPAIPMILALDPARAVLVEARSRKCIFLRETLRQLGLESRTTVVASRYEAFAKAPENSRHFDLLSVRAVRVEPGELRLLGSLLVDGGLLVHFHARGQAPEGIPSLSVQQSLVLQQDGESLATVFVKA